MRLSDHQAHILVNILWGSCFISGVIGGISAEDRVKLFNNIMSQQSYKIVELNGNESQDAI